MADDLKHVPNRVGCGLKVNARFKLPDASVKLKK
jgi:hypothetical protein